MVGRGSCVLVGGGDGGMGWAVHVSVSVSLGKPVHHVVPKCQPMTAFSPTYRKMRKTGVIRKFFC